MAGDVEGGAGPVASILVLGWLRAYAAGRGLPEPVPNHGGLVLGDRAAHETRATCTPRLARA